MYRRGNLLHRHQYYTPFITNILSQYRAQIKKFLFIPKICKEYRTACFPLKVSAKYPYNRLATAQKKLRGIKIIFFKKTLDKTIDMWYNIYRSREWDGMLVWLNGRAADL